jgi:hypothetical protein
MYHVATHHQLQVGVVFSHLSPSQLLRASTLPLSSTVAPALLLDLLCLGHNASRSPRAPLRTPRSQTQLRLLAISSSCARCGQIGPVGLQVVAARGNNAAFAAFTRGGVGLRDLGVDPIVSPNSVPMLMTARNSMDSMDAAIEPHHAPRRHQVGPDNLQAAAARGSDDAPTAFTHGGAGRPTVGRGSERCRPPNSNGGGDLHRYRSWGISKDLSAL